MGTITPNTERIFGPPLQQRARRLDRAAVMTPELKADAHHRGVGRAFDF